jgi:Ca2+-binding RTX toxin-like protein
MRRPWPIAVLLLLAAPQTALAGSVSIGEVLTDAKYGSPEAQLFFQAAPGERNEIVVTRTGPDEAPVYVLHDAGAPVSVLHDAGPPVYPRSGCTAIDANTAGCAASGVFVDAADGDDTVTLPDTTNTGFNSRGAYVRGGDGADILTGAGFLAGGAGNDQLTCPANCVLAGGAGNDVLRGGSGDDLLSGDGDGPAAPIGYITSITDAVDPGSDTIDGGAGRDRLTFRGRTAGVKVDLAAAAVAGHGGERDRLAGIEDLAGGDGDDFLLGDAGDNQLEGDAGDDRIDGRGGDDHLFGNLVPDDNEYSVTYTPADPGADTLHGGAGDDRLDAGSERGDALSGGPGDDVLQDLIGYATKAHSVRCGSGRDTIEFVLQNQRVSGCERLAIEGGASGVTLRPQPRSGGRLRFVSTCAGFIGLPPPLASVGCTIKILVRAGAQPRARRTVKIAAKGRRAFLVTLRRAVHRGDLVGVRFVALDRNLNLYVARWRVRL